MVNLIAGRRIIPELLQDRFNPDTLFDTLAPLLDDTPARFRQISDLADVRSKLATVGSTSIERVRDAVLATLSNPQTKSNINLLP